MGVCGAGSLAQRCNHGFGLGGFPSRFPAAGAPEVARAVAPAVLLPSIWCLRKARSLTNRGEECKYRDLRGSPETSDVLDLGQTRRLLRPSARSYLLGEVGHGTLAST